MPAPCRLGPWLSGVTGRLAITQQLGAWNHLEASSLVCLEPGAGVPRRRGLSAGVLHMVSPCDSGFLPAWWLQTSHGGPASPPRDSMGLLGYRPTSKRKNTDIPHSVERHPRIWDHVFKHAYKVPSRYPLLNQLYCHGT